MTIAPAELLAHIPPPSGRRLALRVTPAAQRALRQGHPWLFEQAITDQREPGRPGDLAVIFDDQRRFLAIGLYDPTSVIRVRILHHGAPAAINQAWFAAQLTAAAARRADLPTQGTTGYRLVHGENDGLPGLVIDRYDAILVLKVYTAAWIPHLPTLLAALAEVMTAQGVVLRLSREMRRQPALLYGLEDAMTLAGDLPNPAVRFTENGLCFEADVLRGQKTGFFFDQRENRAAVAGLAAGRRTLNVFAYTGGFSLYAASGGAPEVLSLDISAPALAAAVRNFELNQHLPAVAAATHTVLAADAFDALAALRERRQRFDLVIVDPPALAKQEREIEGAVRAYQRLTRLSVDVLAPAGTLVMASCSSRVSAADFFAAVEQAAAEVDRPLHIFARSGHALDHPIAFAEGAYLKCLFAAVR
ncbi:class I SAM-dependent rRNA methyltransferase [Candidatus Amarolinea aalborgensis]|uniref:class I SAM-dependent rRNA methyltransferase n=1 Tax=Candidatus Amarolinea aalborgensis TaxID=2249329 RepID=UPI003BF9A3D3